MNRTDEVIIRTMRNTEGTNWTPLAIAERAGEDRGYVKSRMRKLARSGALYRVSRGLYTIPTSH